MFDVGRVCVKLAGRDAGKQCVVVEALEGAFVMVDGQTRRRKVNTAHLIPLDKTLDVSAGADHAAVVEAFKSLNLEVKTTKAKQAANRPRKVRKAKPKAPKKKAASTTSEDKPKKSAAKKAKKTVNKKAPQKDASKSE